MITKKSIIDSYVQQMQARLEMPKLSLKERNKINHTLFVVTNVLCTNVEKLATARLLMEGFASFMSADSEAWHVESYYSDKMKQYVSFIEEAQMRFDSILDSLDVQLAEHPDLMKKYKIVYDQLYSFWIDEDELRLDISKSYLSTLRSILDFNRTFSVEICSDGITKYSALFRDLASFDIHDALPYE